jgi:hypothetical protein
VSSGPTLAGYLLFIRNWMKITTGQLPDDSLYIPASFNFAKMMVNPKMAVVPSPDPSYPNLYAIAVYNLAGDRLVNFAVDQDGETVFTDLRDKCNLAGFVSGIISSSSDETSSQSMVVAKAMETLTFFDLQTMKTPWGRAYMGFAQQMGPTDWGMS